MNLSDLEYGQVIRVHLDGSITYWDFCPPIVHIEGTRDSLTGWYVKESQEDDMLDYLKAQGWDVLTGWTRQYHGAIMHPSEYIGGGMENTSGRIPDCMSALPQRSRVRRVLRLSPSTSAGSWRIIIGITGMSKCLGSRS